MNGIGGSEWVPFKKIFDYGQYLLSELDANRRGPVFLETSAQSRILMSREMSLPLSSIDSGVDLRIGDRGGCRRKMILGKALSVFAPFFQDENLDESTRVEINHCRSSRMAFETGGPETFIGFGF